MGPIVGPHDLDRTETATKSLVKSLKETGDWDAYPYQMGRSDNSWGCDRAATVFSVPNQADQGLPDHLCGRFEGCEGRSRGRNRK